MGYCIVKGVSKRCIARLLLTIEHTLYSHVNTIAPETKSFQKLKYINQHFQENEKLHESEIPIELALKLIILYIHILTTISSMVYSKMSLIFII